MLNIFHLIRFYVELVGGRVLCVVWVIPYIYFFFVCICNLYCCVIVVVVVVVWIMFNGKLYVIEIYKYFT